MADVFISYSRKDKEFVRRLHDALHKLNRDVWVDWEDIPRGVDWLDQIYDGIAQANSFVVVVSPDSLISEICVQETAHAIQHHKRIVPLIRRDIDEKVLAGEWFDKTWENQARDNWRTLKAINWLMFRETDNFDAELSQLVKAIDTDPAHLQAHTRLLVRALEWDKGKRNPSLLLHGSDLTQAQDWLAASGSKEPRATELQTEYILASRQSETRRQRTLLGGVSVALVVALVLALLSFLLYQQSENNLGLAVSNEATAVYRGGVSQSLALAAQAQFEVGGPYPERSVLLALEALENYPFTWQAERALRTAVINDRLRRILTGHAASVTNAAWSPDGARIITASEDGTAKVWDAATGDEMFTISGSGSGQTSAGWSPDGTLIFFAGPDGKRSVRGAATGDELFVLPSRSGLEDTAADAALFAGPSQSDFDAPSELHHVDNMAWSPDGTRIVLVSDSAAAVWDLDSRSELFSLPRDTFQSVKSAAWSPDGGRIATVGSYGTLEMWDAANGDQLFSVEVGHVWADSAAWSPDGTRIVTGQYLTAEVRDATSGDELFALSGHESRITDVAWSPDGTRIVTACEDGTIKVWDAASRDLVVSVVVHAGAVESVAWSPDGTRIVTASADGTAKVWDMAPHGMPFLLSGHTGALTGAVWSPDGQSLVTSSWDGTAKVWDVTTGSVRHTLAANAGVIISTAWSPNGTRIVTGSAGRTATVWDAATGQDLLHLAGKNLEGMDPTVIAVWSPDGTHIVTFHGNGASKIWDALSGEELLSFAGGVFPVWSSDGTRVVLAKNDNIAQVLDARTEKELFPLERTTSEIVSAVWSPDETHVLTIDSDGAVQTWDAATGHERFSLPVSLPVLQNGRPAAAWSPDGTHIITIVQDGKAQVWDAATGDEESNFMVDRPTDAMGQPNAVWSPDGTRIATIVGDYAVKVRDAATGDERLTITGQTGHILTAAWSPDGERIATAGADGIARIWHVWETTDDLIAYAHECCIVRELTAEERAEYGLPPK